MVDILLRVGISASATCVCESFTTMDALTRWDDEPICSGG